jgi:hypothetical protein
VLFASLLAQTPIATDVLSPFQAFIVSLGGFGLTFMLMLFGVLVPKTRHDEVKKERDDYKQLYEVERQSKALLEKSVETLVEQVKTSNHLLQEIKDRPPRNRS